MKTTTSTPRGVAELLNNLIDEMAKKTTKSSLEGIAQIFVTLSDWTLDELYNSFLALQLYKVQIDPDSDTDKNPRLIITSLEDSILEAAREKTSGFTINFGVSERERWIRAYGPGGAEFFAGNIIPGIRRGFGGQPLAASPVATAQRGTQQNASQQQLAQGVTSAEMTQALKQLEGDIIQHLNTLETNVGNLQTAVENLQTHPAAQPVSPNAPVRNYAGFLWTLIIIGFLLLGLNVHQSFFKKAEVGTDTQMDSIIHKRVNAIYERDFMREPSPFDVLDSNIRLVAKNAGIPDSLLIEMLDLKQVQKIDTTKKVVNK